MRHASLLLIFDAPPDALVDAVEPNDVLRVPVVRVDDGTVGDPIGRLESLRPCRKNRQPSSAA